MNFKTLSCVTQCSFSMFLAVAALNAGCSIESPKNYGEQCPGTGGHLSYILMSKTADRETICSFSDKDNPEAWDLCKEYEQNFNANTCPDGRYQFCDKDAEGKYYCHGSSCAVGQHQSANDADRCVNDDIDNCGKAGFSCMSKGVSDAECVNGKCKAISCENDYYLEKDECIANTRNNCGPEHTVCKDSEVCQKGKCAENCGSLEICDDQCIDITKEVKHCGECGHDCNAEIQNQGESDAVESTECINSSCQIKDCKTGYHLNTETGKCDLDTIENCAKLVCEISQSGWLAGACIEGKCVVETCKNGYHLYGEVCEEDTPEFCGPDRITCESNKVCANGKCADSCGVSDTLCPIIGCKNLTTDIDNCGECGNKCIPDKTVQSIECRSGACKIKECKTGYHQEGELCKEDSVANCSGKTCTDLSGWLDGVCENGVCKATSCTENYHVIKDKCEANTATSCGTEGKNCADVEGVKTPTCTDGVCGALECKNGYHIYQGKCEKDDETNCGGHGIKCQKDSTMASNLCKEAAPGKFQCSITCDTDYHLYSAGNGCKADSITACGSEYKNCENTQGWDKGNCTDKKCVPTSCTMDQYNGYFLYDNHCVRGYMETSCQSRLYYCSPGNLNHGGMEQECYSLNSKCMTYMPGYDLADSEYPAICKDADLSNITTMYAGRRELRCRSLEMCNTTNYNYLSGCAIFVRSEKY